MDNKYIVLFLAFLCVFVFVLWCFSSEHKQTASKAPRWFSFFLPMGDVFANDFGEWLSRTFFIFSGKMQKWSDDAGLHWSPARIYGLQITVMLTAVIIVGVLLFMIKVSLFYTVCLLILVAVASFFLPLMSIIRIARKRTAEIARILPFAIDLISSAMNAGLDFASAVRYYTSLKFTDTLSLEFNVLLSEIELGKSRADALRNMADRMKSDDFNRFVSAIVYSLESGTAIIDVMQVQADEIRRLRFTRLEQENAKVPSKMLVPIVLCIVPAVFITVLVPIILSIKDVGLFKLILEKGIW
jgi:tight adherence protein C